MVGIASYRDDREAALFVSLKSSYCVDDPVVWLEGFVLLQRSLQ